ncbi:uncharacterized protein LOC120838440 isoform X2 [Ixodes scapularis]|uniref:uncharacterized protein LOC120838440 isoform X2 n=1 Tax=Ixodes scapularis TaxID=6945 RepID=UPI001C381D11|nr:uncharacterized protein LOC120838440 isoform X2 [Ixodes scapularis]
MRTALTCALLAISFLGSPCSSSEDGHEQVSRVKTTTQSLYERHYRNNPGLCGAQYRNSSYAEPVYNCTLKALPPITVVMPENFYLLYMGDATSNSEEEKQSTGTTEESTAVKVTETLITEAENACTANITGWTPPTTPEPTKSLEPVAVP